MKKPLIAADDAEIIEDVAALRLSS